MASHFIGGAKHLTLLESDANLIGIFKKKKTKKEMNEKIMEETQIKNEEKTVSDEEKIIEDTF